MPNRDVRDLAIEDLANGSVPRATAATHHLATLTPRRLAALAVVVALVVAGGILAYLATRPAPVTYAGTFTATGPMTTPRAGDAATRLPDGRVLIAGGTSDDSTLLASAELYDPASGTFTATGSMTTPRSGHLATLLPDGRVLIAGGYNDDDGITTELSSAELYDPASGSFTATGDMTTSRSGAAAALLDDGRVLIAGGSSASGPSSSTHVASAELYDPDSGSFTATGSMTTARDFPGSTALPDGRVLLAGGQDIHGLAAGEFVLSSAELYDAARGTFSSTGPMTMARAASALTLLPDGRVLVAGGWSNDGVLPFAELYDPSTGAFSATGSMRTARSGATAIVLGDNSVLLAGGENGGPSSELSSAELFR